MWIYIYVHTRVTLLYSRNWHIVNQLYLNKKFKKKTKKLGMLTFFFILTLTIIIQEWKRDYLSNEWTLEDHYDRAIGYPSKLT